MHDKTQLVEVDIILEQSLAMTRHLNEKLVFQVFGHFRVLEAMLVSHCLEQGHFMLVMRVKLRLVLV